MRRLNKGNIAILTVVIKTKVRTILTLFTLFHQKESIMSSLTQSPLIINPYATKSCMLLIHGLTSSGERFAPVAHYLQQYLPNTRFILPSAPEQAVTWANNQTVPAWYNLPHGNFTQNEDQVGILSASETIHALLNDLIAQGFTSENIALGGFSQGAALAFWVGTTFSQPLAAIFGLSGYLPLAKLWETRQTSANLGTPILWQHGAADPYLPLQHIEKGKMLLAKQHHLTFKLYNTTHTIIPEELDDLAQWLGVVGQF